MEDAVIHLFQRVETSDPPEGWDVVGDATWGVDAQRELGGRIGPYRVRLEPTAIDAGVSGPLQPVEDGARYRAWGRFQVDDNTAGNQVVVAVFWYDEAGELLSTSFSGSVTELSDVDEWEVLGGVVTAPAGALLARVACLKTEGNGFTALVDELSIDRMPPAVAASRSTSSQSIDSDTTPSSTNRIIFNTIGDPYDGAIVDTTTGIVTFRIPGTWQIEVVATMDQMPGQSRLWLELWYNGSLAHYGEMARQGGPGSSEARVGLHRVIDVASGDEVEVRVAHNAGSARNLLHASNYTNIRATFIGDF